MKILFLSAWYPNRYDPMPGLFVKQHAEAVSKSHSIAVLYVHPCETETVEIDQKNVNGVLTTIVYYPAVKGSFVGSSVVKGFWFLSAHYRGFKKVKVVFGAPELIHVNILTRCGIVALLFKYFTSIPYVITEHWSRYLPSRNDYKGFLRKFITRLVVRKSEGIVTVSESLREAMISHRIHHKRFEVINNSVDTSLFVPSEAALHTDKKVFSHISCFDDRAKNISGIIRTIHKLSKERQDFELHLIGDGPDKKEIEKLSHTLNLTDRFVFFKGLTEGAELVKAYQESLFTVLFSNYENMPVVVAESFSCGIPVIATHVGGLPEIVNKKNGLLVEVGDGNALLQAINEMLNNYNTFNRNIIRPFAEEKFSKEAFEKAYNNFYSYIYHPKPKGGKALMLI